MQANRSIRCYQYESVYPTKDKELQLEQVRASLPQYSEIHNSQGRTICCYQKDKVYPPTGGEFQLEQLRAMLPKYQYYCDMEMTEMSGTSITVFVQSQASKQYSVGEELMCVDKPLTTNFQPNLSSDCEDGFERELRLLEQDKDMTVASSFDVLQNKENKENERCYSKGKYAFTPDTVESAPNWPCRLVII